MKKTSHNPSLFFGVLLLFGGILVYALSKNGYIGMDIEKISLGIIVFGIALIVGGACNHFIKQGKTTQIEANDERNITIAKTAKAFAFDFNTTVFSAIIVILILTDLISLTVFFVLVAMYVLNQVVFVFKLWSLQKKM